MCDIFDIKDVLKKYEKSCDSLGVMDTCLQPQALGGVTSHLEHETPHYQLLTNGEEG